MPTVTSDTQICNIALSHLEHESISAIGEITTAGEQMEIHYAPARNSLLRSHLWNFAIKRQTLAQDGTTPNHEYTYRYALPTDCLKVIRTDLEALGYNDIDYRIEGGFLYTSDGTVKIEYVREEENVSLYDPLFVDCLALTLAVRTCMKITKSRSMRDSLRQELNDMLNLARSVDAQEGTARHIEADTWLISRY